MFASAFKYDLPSDATSSVVREDGIEYGFIGKLQKHGLKTLGVNPRRAMEQIVSSKNDPGNGYTKTLLCFMQIFIVSNRDRTDDDANNNARQFATDTLALAA